MKSKSLKSSIVLTLLLAMLLIFIAQGLSRQFIELPQLLLLEKKSDDYLRYSVDNVLNSMAYDLSQSALDFSVWDEAYDYISNPTPLFVQNYFTYYVYYSKNINGFMIINNSSKVIFQRAYDWSDGNLIETSPFDKKVQREALLQKLVNGRNPNKQYSTVKGFLDSDLGIIQFAASEILPTSGLGEGKGMIIAWRLVNNTFEEEFARRYLSPVTLSKISDISQASPLHQPMSQLLTNEEDILPRNNGKIHWLIKDINNIPVMIATLTVESRIFKDGVISTAFLAGIFAALLSLFFVGYIVSIKIISPLNRLQKVMAEVVTTSDYSQRLPCTQADEIGKTCIYFNCLLEHISAQEKHLKERNSSLKQISLEDPLTGVLNRRGVSERLKEPWESSIKTQSPIAILMIDIDNFKSFNDNYGHLAGDYALKQVASSLQEQLHHNSTDIIGRFGGEEFIVILTNITKTTMQKVASRLITSIRKLAIEHLFQDTNKIVTVSIGAMIATPTSNSRFEKMVKTADNTLYTAKEKGRNRVEFNFESIE